MSDLDDQLAELIFGLIYHLDKLDPKMELMAVYDVRTLKETVFPSIKQVFKDAGYYGPTDRVDFKNVCTGFGFMTGQEWYERFEKEFAGLLESPSRVNEVTNYTYFESMFQVLALEAAKRASGIDK